MRHNYTLPSTADRVSSTIRFDRAVLADINQYADKHQISLTETVNRLLRYAIDRKKVQTARVAARRAAAR